MEPVAADPAAPPAERKSSSRRAQPRPNTRSPHEPSPAGQIILNRLRDLDLSQAAFGRVIGVTASFLGQIVYGRRRVPIAKIGMIADALLLEGSDKSDFIISAAEEPGRYQRKSVRERGRASERASEQSSSSSN